MDMIERYLNNSRKRRNSPLKIKVAKIINKLTGQSLSSEDIRQTNITFRSHRDQYYFIAGSLVSHYTMKRFIEIYESKEWDKCIEKCGNIYFYKDKKIME